MVSLENTHHYPRLRPVKTLSKLYLKIMTHFSPSPWVLWTPVYEILVKTLLWAVSLSHWPHLLHPIWKGSFKSRKHRPQWWCLSHVGGGDSYGPTVIFVTCAVAVTLPKLANQSYVNKLINQSKYWVELSKQQWCEHSKIIIYSIYHSFQESLWYRLQVILLSNHSWTTSKFLANIYVKFKYKFKIFMMFSGQKSSFISLVHQTGILRKQFWSSLFDTEFTKKFKKRRRIWFVPNLLPNSTQIALIMPITQWHSFFTVYVLWKLF